MEIGLAALTASTKLANLASFDYGIEIVNIIDFLLHRSVAYEPRRLCESAEGLLQQLNCGGP